MRLFLKLTLGILVISAGILGLLVSQRYWRSTDLDRTLRLSETACGLDCWFGIPTGEEMNWRDVQANIEAGGGTDMHFRGDTMRLRIPQEDNDAFNIGHVQVIFNDAGDPIQTCFFVNQFTLGDVLTTFGTPEYFWFNVNSQRFSFNRTLNQPEFYYMNYQLIYPNTAIVVDGTMHINAETNYPLNNDKIAIPLDTPVDSMCTPGNLDYVTLQRLPKWQGIYKSIEFYEAFPPPRESDFTPVQSPPTTNQLNQPPG